MVTTNALRSAINAVSSRYKIKKAILFGSYASGEATEKSDIDLIVEFEEEAISLFDLAGLKYDLEEILGKKVDVIHGPIQEDDLITVREVLPIYEQ